MISLLSATTFAAPSCPLNPQAADYWKLYSDHAYATDRWGGPATFLPGYDNPYIALGIERVASEPKAWPFGKPKHNLDAFMKFIDESEEHRIISFRSFSYYGLIPGFRHSFKEFMDDLEVVLDQAILKNPQKKIILFNLDFLNPLWLLDEHPGFTAAEARLILSRPDYLQATRWFQNEKELSLNEVELFFADFLKSQD